MTTINSNITFDDGKITKCILEISGGKTYTVTLVKGNFNVEEGGIVSSSSTEITMEREPSQHLSGHNPSNVSPHADDLPPKRKNKEAEVLFNRCIKTIKNNIGEYDTNFWSMYEQSGLRMNMLASPFYHQLHIIQLEILYIITNDKIFSDVLQKWKGYKNYRFNRIYSYCHKIIFKLFYY